MLAAYSVDRLLLLTANSCRLSMRDVKCARCQGCPILSIGYESYDHAICTKIKLMLAFVY